MALRKCVTGQWPFLLFVGIALASCASFHIYPDNDFPRGKYIYRQKGTNQVLVYARMMGDTVEVTPMETAPPRKAGDQYFHRPSPDIDVMLAPFKYRPSSQGFPRQLNASFNGNIYLGYRWDRYRARDIDTPVGRRQVIYHRGLGAGVFGGLGAAAINPWTTNYQIADEYDGLVLSRGVAIIMGINRANAGLAIGWDYLTDRDKHIWIYQNKPWFGVVFGLNIN